MLILADSEGRDDSPVDLEVAEGRRHGVSALGDPAGGSTEYTLCLYVGTTGTLAMQADVPPMGTCDGDPCWSTVSNGYKYKDRNLGADGIQRVLLKSGATGRAKVLITGKGTNLPLPPLDLALPVTVQLKNSLDECWGASYSGFTHNDASQFKARN